MLSRASALVRVAVPVRARLGAALPAARPACLAPVLARRGLNHAAEMNVINARVDVGSEEYKARSLLFRSTSHPAPAPSSPSSLLAFPFIFSINFILISLQANYEAMESVVKDLKDKSAHIALGLPSSSLSLLPAPFSSIRYRNHVSNFIFYPFRL